MRRPVDTEMTQAIETHLDRAIAPIERGVHVAVQAGDVCSVDRTHRARGKHRQTSLCGCQFAGQELAFRPGQLECEPEVGPAFPPPSDRSDVPATRYCNADT